MTTYNKSGSFGYAGGGKAGAIVDLWATSRFSAFPVQNEGPPDGNPPDAGPVTTGSDFGNPGGFNVTGITTIQDYYIRIQYGGQTFWGECPAGTLSGNPLVEGTDLPIADPGGGYHVDTTTYDNPVSGSGKMAVAVFPADTAAFAIAIEGDAFPRWVFTSDPTDGFYFGDGTSAAYGGGANLFVQSDGSATLSANTVSVRVGVTTDANRGTYSESQVGFVIEVAMLSSGSGVPAIGGDEGDRYFLTVSPYTEYVCTTAGAAGSAVWTPAYIIPPTSDPHVVGALWNDAGTLTISAG